MKTLFVLYMIAVVLPTHPEYREYVGINGHPLYAFVEVRSDEKNCEERQALLTEKGKENSFDVLESKCVKVEYNEVSGTDAGK